MNVNTRATSLETLFPDISTERWQEIAEAVEAKLPAVLTLPGYSMSNLVDDLSGMLEGEEEHVAFGIIIAEALNYLESSKLVTS